MMRTLPRLSVAAALIGLSACGTPTQSVNRGLESIHQPVVMRSDYAIDLATMADDMTPAEERRLSDWLDAMRIGYGDRITVDIGTNGNGGVRAAVAGVVARYGLLLGQTPPVTSGAVPDGMVRVIVSRSTASVPGCPDWSTASRPFVDGSTDSNFGCAANRNLAAMVADPQDLIEGRSGQASLSTRANTRAMKAYNEIIPSGVTEKLKSESAGGK